MYFLAFFLICTTIIDSLVIVKIHRDAIYIPHSPCAFIRNTTWSKQESIQSCIWECVYEHNCQTAVFFEDEKICSTFLEECTAGNIQSSENISASIICYRKDHDSIVQCSTSATPIQNEEIITTQMKDSSTDTIDQVNTTITSATDTTRKIPRVPQNLLINPGGELGSLSGWTQTGSSDVQLDSNAQFQSGYSQHSGSYCFVGGAGQNGSPSKLVQNVNLISGIQNFTTNELDSGTLKVNVSFYYETYEIFSVYDSVKIILLFRSSTNITLSTISSSTLICSSSISKWCFKTTLYSLPSGTRNIEYSMTFYRGSGIRIVSYIDDNSLEIV